MKRSAAAPLARKVLLGVLSVEIALGLALALTVGAMAMIALAERHREATQDVTNVLAAAVIPVIADQQHERAAATLANIMESARLDDVECVRIVDSSGHVVLTYGDVDRCAVDAIDSASLTPWAVMSKHRIVSHDIETDGLHIATVYVGISPPRLAEVLSIPLGAAALVLIAVMLVSVPWTVWLVNREVIEPLQDLEVYASSIALDSAAPPLRSPRSAEVVSVQEALGHMANRLGEQQRQLQASHDQMSVAYESLERAKGEIERLARIKEDFVAVASHEIGAPLATISLHAETLKTGEVGNLDETALRAVNAIDSAARRLASISSNLMDASLLERGTLRICLDTVWFDEIVEDAVRDEDMIAQAVGKRVRIAGELPEAIIQGDALRLRQVLDNLLSNAIKYSFEDGEIVVVVHDEGSTLLLEVSDCGRGIDAGGRERMFTLFGRADSGDARYVEGLGLGLAISAKIVEAHGGTIGFRENERGEGSVFFVVLPKGGPSGHSQGDVVEARVADGKEHA